MGSGDDSGDDGPARARTIAGLAAEEVGRPDGRAPLVLLHGLTFDRTMWRPALRGLQRIDPDRHALAFDLPGHGASAGWESYDVRSVADGVHRAAAEAGMDRPVVIGHSLGAMVATVYAATYPTSGVVNVDQPLQMGGFATFLQTIADKLRSPAFPAMWEHFAASMHADLLPERVQQLVRETANPRQELVLAYWREVLELSPGELDAMMSETVASLRVAHVPYLMVAGDDDPAYRAWLAEALPAAEVVVFPDSGHFPHLADPARFAAVLASAGT